jgi:hypothetical protein
MTRGVVYLAWPGDIDPEPVLKRSIASLPPDLPHVVHRLPEGSNLLDKPKMFDLSPFDTTLFLDADTIVCGNLDYGFDMADRHGIAVCICEAPYAKRYGGLKNAGDLREFNTGVIFWNRHQHAVDAVFARWKTLAQDLDSSIVFDSDEGRQTMPYNDQAGFAAALDQLKFNPFVLPLNFNFRPVWQRLLFGALKIWHDYDEPPAALLEWSKKQSEPGAVISSLAFT